LITLNKYFISAVGGAEKMRNYWSNFTQDSDILVYVVDATSDAERLRLSGQELQRILDDSALNDVPLILLANKQVCLQKIWDTSKVFNFLVVLNLLSFQLHVVL
jgi:GTPase SAR1 family protein